MVSTLMELQKTTSRILAVFALMLCLGGCETHLNSEPLEIIGTPPKEMYYDSEFKYQFGVKGGNGLYSYRYIANPDNDSVGSGETPGAGGELEGVESKFNPVELTIERLEQNKPGFWLRGTPSLGLGNEGSDLGDQEFKYELEVTDGTATVRREYQFTLKKNELALSSQNSIAREQQANNLRARSLVTAREKGVKTECKQGAERSFEPSVVNGQVVYPLVIGVTLKAIPSRRVEIGYHFVSGYSEGGGELADVNFGVARPGVDYLEETRTLVFEPGEKNCLIYLNVLDDHLIERNELLAVHFSSESGTSVSTSGIIGDITIRDNEPSVTYESIKTTANEGDTVIREFSLSAPYDQPVDILVRVDTDKTTANSDDFSLQPVTGRVTIPAGVTKGSYAVTLLHNDDAGEVEDDVVAIKTSIDKIKDHDPIEIAINKWRIANEVVAKQNEGVEVVDFVYGAGKFFVLSKISTFSGEDALNITSFDAISGAVTGSAVRVAQEGLNISPVAMAYAEGGGIFVVANVDGRFSGFSHYGADDFIVLAFGEDEQGEYRLSSSTQLGSAGDDVVTGLRAVEDGVFAFGSTTGVTSEDGLGDEWSGGSTDGFVYKLGGSELTKTWARLVGTPDDDVVVDVDSGREELIVLANTQSTDSDVFMKALSLSDGATKMFVTEEDSGGDLSRTHLNLSSPFNDMGAKVSFTNAGVNFTAIVSSEADLPSPDPTPTRSMDGAVVFFNAESGNSSSHIKLSTALGDRVVALERLNEEDAMAVGGMTVGEFDGQIRKGTGNNDAFVAYIDGAQSGQSKLSKITQFGTLSDDEVIKIQRINDYKFMVLWSESTTSGDGSKVYRLSPFSIDGTKLTPDP